MNTLVTYYSRTGNTKKIAEAIFEVISEQKAIMPIDEVIDVNQYDLLFVGSPIEQHGITRVVREFLSEKVMKSKVALFITHSAPEGSKSANTYVAECEKIVQGLVDLIGIFNCQGELSEAIANHMMNSGNPQLQKYASTRNNTLNLPDEVRIEKSKQFAREIVKEHQTTVFEYIV